MLKFSKTDSRKVHETAFSAFIRNASAAEKKKVYTQVLENASKRQNEVVRRSESDKSACAPA
jgi:hypothetical protein